MISRPALAFALLCSGCGASDRSTPSQDGAPGDGGDLSDGNPLGFVCDPAGPMNPNGLKAVKYLDATETVYPESDWRLALEPEMVVNWATFDDAEQHEAAMLLDLPDSTIELAGFLVSRSAGTLSAVERGAICR